MNTIFSRQEQYEGLGGLDEKTGFIKVLFSPPKTSLF